MAEVRPQMDEFWIARIQYWPEDETKVDIVFIYYVWSDGSVDFIPFESVDGDAVRSSRCEKFELLEKINIERYAK